MVWVSEKPARRARHVECTREKPVRRARYVECNREKAARHAECSVCQSNLWFLCSTLLADLNLILDLVKHTKHLIYILMAGIFSSKQKRNCTGAQWCLPPGNPSRCQIYVLVKYVCTRVEEQEVFSCFNSTSDTQSQMACYLDSTQW